MKNIVHRSLNILSLVISFQMLTVLADEKTYAPGKAVYDVTSPDIGRINHIFNRAGLLQKMYNNDPISASIILVIHESAIPLFAKLNQHQHKELIQRVESLIMSEVIQLRLCTASAKIQGFKKTDFHEFIAMIPMADAEIIELQNKGYAYLN